MMMEELGKALVADCAAICNDPQYQRSCHVRNLRAALRHWAHENKRLKKVDGELASAIQACARLEQSMNCGTDLDTYKGNQDQISSLHLAAESILAVDDGRVFMAERNKAALDASLVAFGSKGTIPRPDQLGITPLGPRRNDAKPSVKTWTEGWQPRWQGDLGDPFEPYQQLIEQYLHCAVTYHSKTISKKELMAAMKRDKDIAAFMQLSRAKGKDGRRESFDSVFNRIDCQGLGFVTWEAFLHFFSGDISLVGVESNMPTTPHIKAILPP